MGIGPLKSFLTLYIDVWDGLKGSAWPEVVPEIFDGILDLSLSLCTVGITESYNYTIILGEAHELSVEP